MDMMVEKTIGMSTRDDMGRTVSFGIDNQSWYEKNSKGGVWQSGMSCLHFFSSSAFNKPLAKADLEISNLRRSASETWEPNHFKTNCFFCRKKTLNIQVNNSSGNHFVLVNRLGKTFSN